ncbi:MAG: AAA family ATPase [Alphaproteobacteria bacterium]
MDDFYDPPGNPQAAKRSFHLERLADIQPTSEISWRVKGLIPAEGLVFLYGPPAVGKSFCAIHLGLSIAAGLDFAECKTNPASVIYVAAEAGSGARRRIFAAKQAFNLQKDLPLALVTVAPNLGRSDGDADLLIEAIKEQLSDVDLKGAVVVLDTIARVTPGMEENSAKDTGIFIANADRIAKEFCGLVIGVHHPGKVFENGLRGSSALLGAADTVIGIQKGEEGVRTAIVQKQKDGEDSQSFTFTLDVIDIGYDEDGDPISTCILSNISGLARHDAEPGEKRQRIPANLRLLLNVLGSASTDFGEKIRPWADGPEVWALDKNNLRRAYFDARPDNTEDAKRKAFDRHLTKAIDQRFVVSAEVNGKVYLWSIGSAREDI